MTSESIPCSVQILTKNSGSTLRQTLEALRGFDEVIVQDGNSTDDTREIAASFPNVKLLDQNPELLDADGKIIDFAEMRNDGIQAMRNQWVLMNDTGEVLPKEFIDEVREKVSGEPAVYDVFRRFYVNDQKIDHCIGYPSAQIRLYHRSKIDRYVKTIHEKLLLKEGVTVTRMQSELPEVLPPLSVLPKKYAYYRKLEIKRLQGISFLWWARGILYRNLRSTLALTVRLFLLWLIPRRGKRMPIGYDLLHIKQLLLLIPATFPPLNRKPKT